MCYGIFGTLSAKRIDENRVKIMHNMSQNKNGIFSSIFGLNLGHRILSHIDTYLQPYRLKKVFSSKMLPELTIQVLQNMRNERSFNSFYNTVAKKSTECKFIKDPINPRKRKSPNYSTMHLVDGTTSEAQIFTQQHVKIAFD